MEYIIIDNGVITKHGCAQTKPENALEVPSGFPGYVGLPFASLKDDMTGLKPLSQQVEEGIIEQPDGYKINDADNEFIRNTHPRPTPSRDRLRLSTLKRCLIGTGISVTGHRKD